MASYASFKSDKIEKYLKQINDKSKLVKNGNYRYVSGMSTIFIGDVIKHFEQQRGPDGRFWQSWSESYKKFLARKGLSGNKKLQYSGRLRQSIMPIYKNKSRNSQGIVLAINPAKTKSGFPYAAHHDEGPSSSTGKPRSFMWLSKAALERMGQYTLEFLGKGK